MIEAFQFEPVTDCELESINTRTEDKETNTECVPDNEAKCTFLEGFVKSKQRTIEENTSAIPMMRKMLEEKGLSVPDSGDRLLHHGVGNGEPPPPPPSVARRARSLSGMLGNVCTGATASTPPGEAPAQVVDVGGSFISA